MTLEEARAELQARGFAEIEPSRLDVFLNTAKNQFEDAYPFPWLELTYGPAAGPVLVLPNFKQILYVADATNGVELEGVDVRQIIAEYGTDLDQVGDPRVWWSNGQTSIQVWPASETAEINVRYIQEPAELTNDEDQPLIPARYHQTWVDLAAVRAHMDTNAYAEASQLRAVAGQDLAQIINRYATVNRQNSPGQTIRGYGGDW